MSLFWPACSTDHWGREADMEVANGRKLQERWEDRRYRYDLYNKEICKPLGLQADTEWSFSEALLTLPGYEACHNWILLCLDSFCRLLIALSVEARRM